MDEFLKREYPRQSIQSLPESIQSLLGFKKDLTPNWVESVRRIISNLHSLRIDGDSQMSCSESENTESEKDEAISKIQGDINLLNARVNKLNIERRRALNEYLDLKGNIRVFCRIRPLLGDERYSNRRPVVSSDSSTVFLNITDKKTKQYSFDKVLHPHSTQDEVFSEIEPVIKSALDGYNVCIFAYGQTGTGKTYTMEGIPDSPGVVPRGIEALFDQALESNYKLQFTFSMLEIYLGGLRDLLVPRSVKLRIPKAPCLSIQTDPNGGIEIENLTAVKVNNFKEVKKLYKFGNHFRSTAPTLSNSTSSRSHCLIRISITGYRASARCRDTNKMWMVDLGGSERLLKTQASGRRLEEGKAINLSLSALGDVISALQSRKPHVPYRNSKLTQVLRDSLGSDSKSLMLVHVSPKEEDMCETICSLGFATRVRSIHLGSEEAMEMRAKKELAMTELLQKVQSFESERQDVKKDIERLNKRLKQLTGTEPESEGNLENSHLSIESIQPNGKDKIKRAKGSTKAPADLPRFMRPTICSRRKTGTNQPIPLNSSRKPQIPPKQRRPSSVYAESVTYQTKGVDWQSEHGSEFSIPSISNLNWNYSANDGTEWSRETSEYQIKKVIFPEPEKSPRGSKSSFSDENCHELEDSQTNKLDYENNLVIDNWLQLQMEEQNSSCTQWNKRVPAIPTDAKKSSPDANENLNDFREELRLYKTIENFDESMIKGEPHKDTPITVSSSSDVASKKHLQKIDSDQIYQRFECIRENKQECTNGCEEIESGNETALAERGTPVTKEMAMLLNSYNEDSSSSKEHNRDNEETRQLSTRCRRQLLTAEDKAKLVQKFAALGDSAVTIANSEEGKHAKGASQLLGHTVRRIWAIALLGLGIRRLGFEDDFFQGLTL